MGHFAIDWPGSAIFIVAPAVALAMGLGPAEVGLLIAIHSAGASLAFLPAGLLADLVRNRGVLLAATFWWVIVGYLAASMSPGFWTLALALCLADLGDAAWHPIATGVMVEQMPGRRARVLGIHAIGGTLAAVGAPLVAGFLLTRFEWRAVLQFSVLPAVLLGFVFAWRSSWIPARKASGLSLSDVRSLVRIWLEPRGLRAIGIVVLYNMSLMAVLAMLPLYMQSTQGYTSAETGALFAAIWLLGAAAQPVLGAISDTIGRKRVAVAGLLAAGLLLGLMIIVSHPQWLIVVAVAGVGTLGGIRAVLLASMVDVTGKHESTTLGFAFAVMDGLGALGAMLAGALGSIDLGYAFLLAAGLSVAAVGLTLGHSFGPRPAESRAA